MKELGNGFDGTLSKALESSKLASGKPKWLQDYILSELRDLYYPFEMYFDDDVFVCKEIPSGFDDPPVLDPETFEKLVTNDGESATVDYAAVRNCVEVFGATIEADGAATVKGWSGTNKTINLVLNATESTWKSETKVSFVAPANVEAAKTDKNGNVTSGAMTVGERDRTPSYRDPSDPDQRSNAGMV